MTFDPILLAVGALGGLVGCVVGLAGGLAMLWWMHRREMREFEAGCRVVDAASDRYDGAYTRAELARVYERAGP
jgi:hypothetical protein